MRLMHAACWFALLPPLVASAAEPPVDQDGRPRIKKLGTIDVDKVENSPVVFHGKLYRCEWYRNKGWFHFVEHDTGRTMPEFAQGWCESGTSGPDSVPRNARCPFGEARGARFSTVLHPIRVISEGPFSDPTPRPGRFAPGSKGSKQPPSSSAKAFRGVV